MLRVALTLLTAVWFASTAHAQGRIGAAGLGQGMNGSCPMSANGAGGPMASGANFQAAMSPQQQMGLGTGLGQGSGLNANFMGGGGMLSGYNAMPWTSSMAQGGGDASSNFNNGFSMGVMMAMMNYQMMINNQQAVAGKKNNPDEVAKVATSTTTRPKVTAAKARPRPRSRAKKAASKASGGAS
jgi:hypothetical protein